MTISISTGNISRDYEVLDSIFALDSHKAGFFSGNIDPGKAFDGVKKQLKDKCKSLGGDAVISCQFEYRNALADGVFGKKQAIEIFAYGTAIRYL